MTNIKHGTQYAYNSLGCRCDECKEGNRERTREAVERRRAAIKADDPRHGTASFYSNHGCRCEACTDASRKRQTAARHGGVAPVEGGADVKGMVLAQDGRCKCCGEMATPSSWVVRGDVVVCRECFIVLNTVELNRGRVDAALRFLEPRKVGF